MRRTSAATSEAIGVLIADSNRMQAQLLTSALRRHPELHVNTAEWIPIPSLKPLPQSLPAWPCCR